MLRAAILAAGGLWFNAYGDTGPYPNKLIRLAVPFAAGTGDALARFIAERLGSRLKQSVIVENKPGAGTVIGTDYVAKSAGDGYTLLYMTGSLTIVPSLMKLPFNLKTDFTPITTLGFGSNFVVVRADSPYRTLSQLVAAGKANPGKLNFGSAGNGTFAHLCAELLNSSAKIESVHVPYKGTSAALTGMLDGSIDYLLGDGLPVLPLVKGGKVRVLAVTSKERWDVMPEVPTVAEAANLPGFEAVGFYGIMAPAGLPPAILEKLSTELKAIIQEPEVKRMMESSALIPTYMASMDFRAYLDVETEKWAKVIKEKNIKIVY